MRLNDVASDTQYVLSLKYQPHFEMYSINKYVVLFHEILIISSQTTCY